MTVWKIPDRRYDPERFYPKNPYVEKRKCAAFRCKNRRSLSFPWIKKNPWCTDHSKLVYFAGQTWMNAEHIHQLQEAAKPPTNVFTYTWKKWRHGRV
jgi:hypothetical protein